MALGCLGSHAHTARPAAADAIAGDLAPRDASQGLSVLGASSVTSRQLLRHLSVHHDLLTEKPPRTRRLAATCQHIMIFRSGERLVVSQPEAVWQ